MIMVDHKKVARKHRMWMNVGVICSVVLALGGLLLLTLTTYQTTRYEVNQQTTTGRIVHFYSTRTGQEYGLVEFTTADGETHTARTETTQKDFYKHSESLPVRYGSNDPSNAMAGDIESPHYLSTGYIVGPILLLLGGFLTFVQVSSTKLLKKA